MNLYTEERWRRRIAKEVNAERQEELRRRFIEKLNKDGVLHERRQQLDLALAEYDELSPTDKATFRRLIGKNGVGA